MLGTADLIRSAGGEAPDHAIDQLEKFFSFCLKRPGKVPKTQQDGAGFGLMFIGAVAVLGAASSIFMSAA
ncbi:hypothetical protein CIC12_24495 [Burkholderia sp. SG-MS1]|nr:hypothetical protein [Paraburkholderia sp. SG-MS1]